MKYRSRTEILAMILKSASEDRVTRTKIMYKAYLSYGQTKEYLTYLQENGLLEYQEGSQTFRISQKGWEFLRAFDTIIEVAPPVENNYKLKALL